MRGRSRAVGSDRVLVKRDGRVAVHASCEMPAWKATRYRRTAVVFEGRTYFVASRLPLAAGAFRYVLEPWPDDLHDPPGRTLHYDEAYVRERDQGSRKQIRLERKAAALAGVAWLLGFLPSGTKLRLNERYGIHPLTVTRQSVFLEYLVLLQVGALLVIGLVGAGVGPAFGAAPQAVLTGILRPVRLLVVGALLLPDALIRYGRVQRGAMRQYGFGEWLFHRLEDDA